MRNKIINLTADTTWQTLGAEQGFPKSVKSVKMRTRTDVVSWYKYAGAEEYMSIGTTERFGSGLGILLPFKTVLEYRPPSPRTCTYFPSVTLTPVTRWSASPASPVDPFFICSALIPSD